MTLDGYRITQRRVLLGYTQEELAHLVNTSQKMISLYESGSVPNGTKLKLLAEALDTTTDYLVGLTDNPDKPLRNVGDLSEDEREILRTLRSNRDYLKMVKAFLKTIAASVG